MVALLGVLAFNSTDQTSASQTAGDGRGTAPAVVVPRGRPTVSLWPNGAPGSETRRTGKDQGELGMIK
jgi:hypothetical protein